MTLDYEPKSQRQAVPWLKIGAVYSSLAALVFSLLLLVNAWYVCSNNPPYPFIVRLLAGTQSLWIMALFLFAASIWSQVMCFIEKRERKAAALGILFSILTTCSYCVFAVWFHRNVYIDHFG